MRFDVQTKRIEDVAAKLLESGEAETVIGFAKGEVDDTGIPVIISEAAEAQRLIWSDRCVANLASYALVCGGKIAVVAKPCDVRALVSLIAEKQIERQNVHIIGVDCPGMKDRSGQMLSACRDCKVHKPPLFDTYIAGEMEDGTVCGGAASEKADAAESEVEGFLEETEQQNDLARFLSEMDKCILCYSCRQACYGCYCPTCFMDRGMPDWQPTNPDLGAKMMYHLGRAMHLAGRCVECGACENTCASGVDVRYLIRAVTGFVKELYDYEAGLDPEAEPAMLTYSAEDREVGFLGGDAHG